MKITSKKDEEKSFIFMNLFDFWVALKPQQYVHRFFFTPLLDNDTK